MMNIGGNVLVALGATQVFKIDKFEDPLTEEEFNLLEYESPVIITWQQYQEMYPIIEQKFGLRYLRKHRDDLLKKTDWIMTVDSFQTLSNKEDWIAYRQALRDIPSNPPSFKWKNGDIEVKEMFPAEPPIIRIISTQ